MIHRSHFQFRLSDLLTFLAFSAVASWLVSLSLSWLVPIAMAGFFGYTGAGKSGYHVVLSVSGGLAFGLAMVVSCVMTYATFFNRFRGMFGMWGNIQIGLTSIAWLVTLILFLQFRKLTKKPMDSRISKNTI